MATPVVQHRVRGRQQPLVQVMSSMPCTAHGALLIKLPTECSVAGTQVVPYDAFTSQQQAQQLEEVELPEMPAAKRMRLSAAGAVP